MRDSFGLCPFSNGDGIFYFGRSLYIYQSLATPERGVVWRSEHFETVWTKPWLLLFKWDKTTARDVIFGSGWLINQPQSWNDEENWRWASDLGMNSPASGDQDPHMKGMTHLLGSHQCIFSVWQVVEMLSGGGEKKPTTKDCINQLGALEWFECSRALVCSSSEVFTSVNYRVLG